MTKITALEDDEEQPEEILSNTATTTAVPLEQTIERVIEVIPENSETVLVSKRTDSNEIERSSELVLVEEAVEQEIIFPRKSAVPNSGTPPVNVIPFESVGDRFSETELDNQNNFFDENDNTVLKNRKAYQGAGTKYQEVSTTSRGGANKEFKSSFVKNQQNFDLNVEDDGASNRFSRDHQIGTGSVYLYGSIQKSVTASGQTSNMDVSSDVGRSALRKVLDTSNVTSPGLRMLYDSRIKELEEELDLERSAKVKNNRQKEELQNDISLLSERLEEATDYSKRQADLNRKLELDFSKIQRDFEDCQLQAEVQVSSFRKKQQDNIGQLQDQIDSLQKIKHRSEKEKGHLKTEIDDLKNQLEQFNKGRIQADKVCKQLDSQVNDLKSQLGEFQRDKSEWTNFKMKLQTENSELGKRFEDLESQLQIAQKNKINFIKQLEEMKQSLDEESGMRCKLSMDNRNLQAVIDQLQEQLEEEIMARDDIQRQMAKSLNEANAWKQKWESGEGNLRPEEVEEMKKKMQARILDQEAQLEAMVGKVSGMEKAKVRLQQENQTLLNDLEKLQAIDVQHEKRQRQFDKTLDEWKRKVTDQQMELESLQRESRNSAAETYKVKSQLDEALEALEVAKRENKNLSEEIYELTDQVGQTNQRAVDMEKSVKRVEAERDELHAALEEAEHVLENDEARYQQSVQEAASLKEEMNRRLGEKEEEIDNVTKNQQRVLESMQIDLETEVRHKLDALKGKKRLEQVINDLENALEVSNRAKMDVEKNFKRFQQQTTDFQRLLDDEQRLKTNAQKEVVLAERKASQSISKLEEVKAQMDISERNRRLAEDELQKLADMIQELTNNNTNLTAVKKKLEIDLQALQVEIEDKTIASKNSEEQMRKAMADAAKVAEELRQEQDHASQIDKLRRALEGQVRDLQRRLDEAEASVLQGGKKTIQQLEHRIADAEKEAENEQQKHAETQKILRKQERRIQEVHFQLEEANKEKEKLTAAIEKLQLKINGYKKQAIEAEEVASLNIGKFRKLQHELEESEARVEAAENMTGQLRSKGRTASVARGGESLLGSTRVSDLANAPSSNATSDLHYNYSPSGLSTSIHGGLGSLSGERLGESDDHHYFGGLGDLRGKSSTRVYSSTTASGEGNMGPGSTRSGSVGLGHLISASERSFGDRLSGGIVKTTRYYESSDMS